MDLKTEVGREWMRRIVLLLLSFAGLAEQASVRSWRVRRNVLAILRRGETAAFWIVSGAARDCGAPLPLQAVAAGRHWKFDDDGDDPENALRLAHRFRALAVALTFLLALAEQQAICPGEHPAAGNAVSASVAPSSLTAAAERAAIRAPPRHAA